MEASYYVDLSGKTAGPFSIKELGDLLRAGSINQDTIFARENSVEWLPVKTILPLINSNTPPPLLASPEPTPRKRVAYAGDLLCTQCGHVGSYKLKSPSSFLMEVGVWLLGLVLIPFFGIGFLVLIGAFIFSLYRVFGRRRVCPSCFNPALIPATSPRGRSEFNIAPGKPPARLGWIIVILGLSLPLIALAIYINRNL